MMFGPLFGEVISIWSRDSPCLSHGRSRGVKAEAANGHGMDAGLILIVVQRRILTHGYPRSVFGPNPLF